MFMHFCCFRFKLLSVSTYCRHTSFYTEDEPEVRSTAAEASEPEAPARGRADSGVEPEAKRHRSAGVDGLLPEAQRGVLCVCRHCDGGFGSRNMMFKHLKELGLEKRDPTGSVEGSPPRTDKGRRAGLAFQDQHRQGGPVKSKPTVTWADLSDDEQL